MRIRELDLLRMVAVLMVLGSHMRPAPPGATAFMKTVADYWTQCGWMGVDLFFVLSGFLVSGLLFREHQRFGHVAIGRFLVRRGLKIYPAFYVLLAISAVVFTVPVFASFRWKEMTSWDFLCEALFIQNYGGSVWNHTWSLGVEEHFYLLLALVIWWRTRQTRANPSDAFLGMGSVVLAVSATALALRVLHFGAHGANYTFTHLRLDSLLFGVWLSYQYTYHHARFERLVDAHAVPIACLSLCLILPCTLLGLGQSGFLNTVGFTFLYLGFGGILAVVLCSRAAKRLVRLPSAWLAPLGVYSYSIYLFHMPVRRASLVVIDRFAPGLPFPLSFGLYMAASIVAGVVISRLLEIPVLRVRDLVFPSRVEPGRATAVAEGSPQGSAGSPQGSAV
jgi:peptidoglycan/LPS O-acetylase OafA/YrhL